MLATQRTDNTVESRIFTHYDFSPAPSVVVSNLQLANAVNQSDETAPSFTFPHVGKTGQDRAIAIGRLTSSVDLHRSNLAVQPSISCCQAENPTFPASGKKRQHPT